MDIDFSEINYLQDPTWRDLHADYEQFLLSMTGPTVIDVTGENQDKCRVFTTLLHGNEPSGLIALHRYLTEIVPQKKPATNLRFIICSIEAATSRPLFSKRFIDGGMDINRCFGKNCYFEYLDAQKGYCQRASLIEQAISEVKPEMVIDLHNSSSSGPTFAISSVVTTETLSLASLFCQTLILSDLKIGSIMEQDFKCPFITIECGGCQDEQAHEIAFSGISQVASCESIGYIHQEKPVEVIYRPLRLQLKPDIKLSYAQHDEGYSGVTLKDNIECFNFGSALQDEMLGWIDGNGLNSLQLIDKVGTDVLNEYFYARENQLVCRHNLRLFKATTNKNTAINDCLFYVVKLASTNNA
ncbi:succinylglutamate desuccinylase/aspartoacylase domain-containing protein [Colwellia psychrerythraea]|uniref:Succinylglutamate desuccinylase/aspartoacylase n=1 Tax=Colwellia psychrerythraea TaxID=28229 RepID=A0A099KBK2_COLPS|nr:succinylglutamate desuccinylase/aspartoacylase family protein [Colwellia psychrerythraea]KGJ87721.1 Succinylglutamate desuccinylase/aspartoacylase [Colwellia psychrerythraea]